MTSFLARHLALDLRAGAGGDAGAPPSWTYLLPDPWPRTVVAVGEVPDDRIAALQERGARIVRETPSGVAVDLVVAGPGATAATLAHLATAHRDATTVLLPGGPRPGAAAVVHRMRADVEVEQVEADGPPDRLAVALPAPPPPPTRSQRVGARLRRLGGVDVVEQVTAPLYPQVGRVAVDDTVVVLPAGVRRQGPPAYAVAAGAPDRARWSVVGLQGPDARKAVFLPVRRDGTVVKVAGTRAAREGLEQEGAVLTALGEVARAHGWLPAVVSVRDDEHLVVLSQTRVVGEPFEIEATGTPVGPLLGSALDALHRLASATVRRDDVDVAGPLHELVARFASAFGDGPVVDRLRRDVATVARGPAPTVTVHGDPRPENLIVQDGARIGFVDWEDGELVGPPVWDLVQLLLTDVEMWLTRRGRRVTGRTLAEQLFGRGDWAHRLNRELARACGEVGVPGPAAEALARLQLAALARRELPTLRPGHERDGVRYRLLAEVVRSLDDTGDQDLP